MEVGCGVHNSMKTFNRMMNVVVLTKTRMEPIEKYNKLEQLDEKDFNQI